ncbi:MAG: type II secretion system F family protein [Clostridia bacterium]|nr:type II secretion system F family protein [Clostridia bacterium]
MPEKNELKKFKYLAVDINRKKSAGFMLAKNKDDLKHLLLKANLYLVSCKVVSDNVINFFSTSTTIKTAEITTFCREFSIMINSGMTIVDSLELLKEQPYSSLFKRILTTVHNDVRSGLLLSEAFGKYNKIFPEMFISMVYVAELSGSLDVTLIELASYYERNYKIERKAKNALIYPTLLSVLTVGVIILLMVAIVPTFKSTLEKLDVEMPPITKTIISISDFVVTNYAYLLLGLLVAILIIYLLFRIEKVKYLWDAFKATAPLISKVTSSLVCASFTRGFSALISGGVDVVKSLEIMRNIIKNRYYKQKYDLAYKEVIMGSSISAAFAKYKVFPKILTQIIATGENSGSLDTVLAKSTSYFDENIETALLRMTTLIEPLIICIMGVIIAIVILAVFSPLLSIMNTL